MLETRANGDDDGYSVVPGHALDVTDRSALATAIDRHERAMMPAPDDVVVTELARLRVLTRAQQSGDEDLKLAMGVYAEGLRAYPADVVLTVLREWPSRSIWWPAWKELRDELERLTRRRRSRLGALRRLAAGDVPPSIEDARAAREKDEAERGKNHQEVLGVAARLFHPPCGQSPAQAMASTLPSGTRGEFWRMVGDGMTPAEALAAVSEKQSHASRESAA